MTNFGRKVVTLSHDADRTVRFVLEVDVAAQGTWHRYAEVDVAPGKSIEHAFPDGFAAHWIRVIANHTSKATAWFRYEPAVR
jgi:hypothetical protein